MCICLYVYLYIAMSRVKSEDIEMSIQLCVRQEADEFEASLGYVTRRCLFKKMYIQKPSVGAGG
jgi:hypothetical protein